MAIPLLKSPQQAQANLWESTQAPYSQEAEEATLGAVLVSSPLYVSIASFLKPEDFFIVRHRYIWESFARLQTRGETIDYISVRTELEAMGRLGEIGGAAYLTQLVNNTPSAINGPVYARLVKAAAVRRFGLRFGDDFKQRMFDQKTPLHEHMAQLSKLYHEWLAMVPNTTSLHAGAIVAGIIDDLGKPNATRPHIKTGLKAYDDLFGGFGPGQLHVLGADTGMGKTWLLLNYAANNPDKRIMFFSTEMSRESIMWRLERLVTGVSKNDIDEGRATPAERKQVIDALKTVSQYKLIVDHDPNAQLTPERVMSRAMHIKGTFGLDMIIVDHATDMALETDSKKARLVGEEKQGAIAEGLKLVATALNVPVLATVQINREVLSDKDRRPQKHHLRGSGRWEQLAHCITMLYRDEVYNEATEFPNVAELIVRKIREDGDRGTVSVFCEKQRRRFLNATERRIDLSALGYPVPTPDPVAKSRDRYLEIITG